jgi:hypothetical protein
LSSVLAEEEAHRDALQEGLNRLTEQHTRGAALIGAGESAAGALGSLVS